MSINPIIDIESLIQPISSELPHGSDLRLDRSPTSDYYTIKDARNTARAAERSSVFGDQDVDLISPWKTVYQVAPQILKSSSKDLEIASWYLESLVRLEGPAGLRDGIKLISKLVEKYWGNIYPLPDEDGLETTVAPLTGLNGDGGDGTLIIPIRNVALTQEGEFGEFNFWQYQQARDADRITEEEEKQARVQSLGYSLADITNTISATSMQDSIAIVDTFEESLNDFKTLANTLREHCGHDAPPSTNISNLLDEILRTARFLYKDKISQAKAQTEAEESRNVEADISTPSNLGENVAQQMPGKSGPISGREDALKRLEEVASYFRQYEPHTPIAPSLERIVGWGRLTVSELMMQLLPDEQARGIYSQLTGVILDGSDTKTYVAPIEPKAAPANNTSTSETNNTQNSTPADSGNVGW